MVDGPKEVLDQMGEATDHFCECEALKATCPAHQLLLDPRIVDHMGFVATQRDQLQREEWDCG